MNGALQVGMWRYKLTTLQVTLVRCGACGFRSQLNRIH